jgi:hypothetical protein
MSEYNRLIEGIKDRYHQRILAVLGRVRNRLTEVGIDCDTPTTMHIDHHYSWTFTATVPGLEPVAIDLKIVEAARYGEERDDGKPGINFALRFLALGGQLLGTFSPYNNMPEFWVDATDKRAVEERFRLFEEADVSAVSNLVLQSPRSKETSEDVKWARGG